MSVGFPSGKNDIDNRAGSLALSLRDELQRIRLFQTWLTGQPDASLTAVGYTSGEVATLKSAFTDLDKLAQVYLGLTTQSSTYDFQTFAKLLVGVI